MKIILIIFLLCSILKPLVTAGEYRVNLEAAVIEKLQGPECLKLSGDDAEVYACRFVFRKRFEMVTFRVYTGLPRDPLTRGTIIKTDIEEAYAFGFRPPIEAAEVEHRFLDKSGNVRVIKQTLHRYAASEFDSALVRSGFFELDPVGPWLLTSDSDETGENLLGELVIDGRTSTVRRFTGGSLPASACFDAIYKAVGSIEIIEHEQDSPPAETEPDNPDQP